MKNTSYSKNRLPASIEGKGDLSEVHTVHVSSFVGKWVP